MLVLMLVCVKTAALKAKMEEVMIGSAFVITARMDVIKMAKRCQALSLRPTGVG